jgi:peroxiredoxin Q/BCP
MLLIAPAFADTPAEGKPAPAFKLQSQDGKEVSLSDFKGKWVVLYFYPKDGTPGCSLEAKQFQGDIDKYKALNAEIVGVSMDDAASHAKFRASQGLTYTLLADTKGEVSRAYGSAAETGFLSQTQRNTFLIDPDGVLRMTYLNVEPGTHSTTVLEELPALQGM